MFYSGRHLVSFNGKNRNLNIDIDLGASCGSTKDLEIRLTDDDDFYFLYSTKISVSEFTNIKQQQGLLINFDEFEQKVVDLLHMCSQEESTENSRYGLQFSRNTEEDGCGLLQIVEATNFKYLHHLSLNLYAANDEKLKLYLVSRLKKHQAESDTIIKQLNQSVSELKLSLNSAEEATKSIMGEFQTFKAECAAKESNLRFENESTIKELQLRHDKVKTKLEESLSKEKDLANQMQEELQKDFKSRLDLALGNNKNLRDHQSVLQTRVERLQEKLKFSETENISLTEDIKKLRSQLDTTRQACELQTETVNQLQTKIYVMEEDMTTKSKQLSELENLLAKEQEQKSQLLEQSEHHCRNIQNLEKHLTSSTEEINKSNEIIKRLQNEVKSFQTKAKLRGQVASEQERLLVSKDSEIQRLNIELDKLRSEIANVKKLNTQLVGEHNQTLQSLADAQKTIKSNETIITWLNRQIAENDSGYVQNRLKLLPFPAINVSTGIAGPLNSTLNALTVISTKNENPLAFETTLLSNARLVQPSDPSRIVPLCDAYTTPITITSLSNTDILRTVDKKSSETTNDPNINLHVRNTSSSLDDTTYQSIIHTTYLPTSTSSYMVPKENCDLINPNNKVNYTDLRLPTGISKTLTTESANYNGKVRNISDYEIPTKCSGHISCTDDENYHQPSLASAYFPHALP
ncbi:Spindle assembly abnormal protein 6 like [Schistosoma japonicum]|nr:Spindle assembly abnormal protein 6 like [Schistosoma japonicum]